MVDNFEKLKYFHGKICTILTGPSTKIFTPETHANCFTGIVESIDEYGIWITQVGTKYKSFLAAPIVGIIEEPCTPVNSEEAEKISNTAQVIKQAEKLQMPEIKYPGVISVEKMEEMARKAKEKYKK